MREWRSESAAPGAIAIAIGGLRERLPRLAGVALAKAFPLGISASEAIDYRGWDFRAGVLSDDIAEPQIAPDWFQGLEISCRLLDDR